MGSQESKGREILDPLALWSRSKTVLSSSKISCQTRQRTIHGEENISRSAVPFQWQTKYGKNPSTWQKEKRFCFQPVWIPPPLPHPMCPWEFTPKCLRELTSRAYDKIVQTWVLFGSFSSSLLGSGSVGLAGVDSRSHMCSFSRLTSIFFACFA